MSSFNETDFLGFLTAADLAQGYREVFRIYQYDTLRLNVWPEGAVFARDMERGFQCKILGDVSRLGQQIRTEFNCDSGAIASSVLQEM